MWSFQCGAHVTEAHSLASLISTMAGHRGGRNTHLPSHLHQGCKVPHDIVLIVSPCQVPDCRFEFDATVSPAQSAAVKLLDCRLVKK